jgi:hypothetical protein
MEKISGVMQHTACCMPLILARARQVAADRKKAAGSNASGWMIDVIDCRGRCRGGLSRTGRRQL